MPTVTTREGTIGIKTTAAGLASDVPAAHQPGSAAIATGTAGAAVGKGAAGTIAAAAAHVKQAPVFRLPPGPVITSPDRLFAAFTREVILRRPQEFKISALKEIASLFPHGSSPFYAGFGNRDTDFVSYRAVGMPDSKIFIINPAGDVRLFSGAYRKSYPLLNSLVHDMFPLTTEAPIDAALVGPRFGRPVAVDESFGDAQYWKPSIAMGTGTGMGGGDKERDKKGVIAEVAPIGPTNFPAKVDAKKAAAAAAEKAKAGAVIAQAMKAALANAAKERERVKKEREEQEKAAKAQAQAQAAAAAKAAEAKAVAVAAASSGGSAAAPSTGAAAVDGGAASSQTSASAATAAKPAPAPAPVIASGAAAASQPAAGSTPAGPAGTSAGAAKSDAVRLPMSMSLGLSILGGGRY